MLLDKIPPGSDNKQTSYLGEQPEAPSMNTQRLTGQLEQPILPWVLEFRIVGTAHIIKTPTRSALLLGRLDEERGVVPDIDLTDYQGQQLGVSRRHALLLARNNRVTVQDLSSANGTYINGRILKANQEYRIRDRDRIRLGRLELQVHFVVKPLVDEQTMVGMRNTVHVPLIGRGEHVLILDDNEDVGRVMRHVVQRAGFRVSVVTDVQDAIRTIDSDTPDLVILELVLQDGSGLDIVRYLRNREKMVTRETREAPGNLLDRLESSSSASSENAIPEAPASEADATEESKSDTVRASAIDASLAKSKDTADVLSAEVAISAEAKNQQSAAAPEGKNEKVVSPQPATQKLLKPVNENIAEGFAAGPETIAAVATLAADSEASAKTQPSSTTLRKRIPVMAVTAATGGYQIGQAIQQGVDVFLGKPVAIDELIGDLKKIYTLLKE